MGDPLLGAVAGLLVALVCTPVGVSGAVLLLPVQTSLLGLAGPQVSSTNLLFNVVSTPGGLTRLARSTLLARTDLIAVLVVAVPAAVCGALLRVTVLADADTFRLLVAAALLPLAATLGWRFFRPAAAGAVGVAARQPPAGTGHATAEAAAGQVASLAALAAVTSLIGAAIGFGGGSLLAPALVAATSRGPHRVAPLALLATLTTSVAGLVAYSVLEQVDFGARPAAPDWSVGLAVGAGGLVGSLLGARLQPYLPERALTGLLALLVGAVAVAQLLRG